MVPAPNLKWHTTLDPSSYRAAGPRNLVAPTRLADLRDRNVVGSASEGYILVYSDL